MGRPTNQKPSTPASRAMAPRITAFFICEPDIRFSLGPFRQSELRVVGSAITREKLNGRVFALRFDVSLTPGLAYPREFIVARHSAVGQMSMSLGRMSIAGWLGT